MQLDTKQGIKSKLYVPILQKSTVLFQMETDARTVRLQMSQSGSMF